MTPALMTVGGDSCRLPETGIATINARIDADARAAGPRILLSQVIRVLSLMLPNKYSAELPTALPPQGCKVARALPLREGTYPRGLKPVDAVPMTFREFAKIYRERHVIARRLSIAKDYTWSVRPFVERFGDRALADIRKRADQPHDELARMFGWGCTDVTSSRGAAATQYAPLAYRSTLGD